MGAEAPPSEGLRSAATHPQSSLVDSWAQQLCSERKRQETGIMESGDFLTAAQLDAHIQSVKSQKDAEEVACEEIKSLGPGKKSARVYRGLGSGSIFVLASREAALRRQEVQIADLADTVATLEGMKQ